MASQITYAFQRLRHGGKVHGRRNTASHSGHFISGEGVPVFTAEESVRRQFLPPADSRTINCLNWLSYIGLHNNVSYLLFLNWALSLQKYQIRDYIVIIKCKVTSFRLACSQLGLCALLWLQEDTGPSPVRFRTLTAVKRYVFLLLSCVLI